MAVKRVSREITKTDPLYDELINITEPDICSSYIFELFGEFNGKSKCNPFDTITIPTGKYGSEKKKNTKPFTTTVGIWIFNKYMVELELFHILGYINKTINKKLFKKINSDLSYALIEDDITVNELDNFLEKTQIIMNWTSVLSYNYSEELLTCTDKINKRKAQLAKQYDKELKAGDIIVAETIEKELLDYALELLKDDPAMDGFRSGAMGDIGNNFKNMYVMKGAVRDADPLAKKTYEIALSNYMDGISKEEYALYAKSLSAGPYSRNKKTQIGGYWEKLFVSAFQHLRIGPPNSNCGTKRTVSVHLTDNNISEWMYSYIVEKDSLIELTSKNKDKYKGKQVKFRFSAKCECKDYYCSKCVGNFFYRMNYQEAMGPMFAQIPTSLKLIAMKAFHDSTIATSEMDPMEVFGWEE